MQNLKAVDSLKMHSPMRVPVIAIFLSLVVFAAAYILKVPFSRIVHPATYLVWHNILEICGTIVCFAIFLVSYLTYGRTHNLRVIVMGVFLLCVGLLEIFHTFSFKGMPDFIISNDGPNRATTLWIISRLVAATGFLVVSFIDIKTKSGFNRSIFVAAALAFAFIPLIITTWYPDLLPKMYVDGTGLTLTKKVLEFIVSIIFLATVIRLYSQYLKTSDRLLLLFATAMILNIFSEISFVSYSQVYDIYNYIGHLYKALSYLFIFQVIFVRNVLKPYEDLSAAQLELKNYVDNLDKIVEQRTSQLKQMNRKLLDDLEYARDIQKSMLPSVLPEITGLTFSTFYYPAERLSGDFYNIYKVDEQYLGMYMCDVSGHGVPAAMLTVFLKQCIENRLEADKSNGRVSTPSEMLQSVYDSFNNTNFKDEVYIVLIYALFDIRNYNMTYSSAGMNVAPLILKKDGSVAELPVNGFPIIKLKNIFDVHYKDDFVVLEQGDKILFYTDGLVEVENRKGEQFSSERLAGMLSENGNEKGEKLTTLIYEKLFTFIDGKKIKDDITLFLMDIVE